MNFFLDTNICIYFLKGQKEEVSNNLKKLKPEQVKIPAIVKAELLLGVHKSQHSKRNKEFLNLMKSCPLETVKPKPIRKFERN